MQAVTASRLRASTRPTPIQRNVTSVSNAASQKAPRDKSKEKIGTIERKASGLQKKKRDSTISKDSTNKSISAPTPRTSQLKAFRDFLGLLKDGPEFLLSRPRLNQSALQLLAHTFLTPPKDKSLSFLTLRLIAICYGNTLRVGSVEQLRFEDASSAQSFLEFLTNRWATRDIFPLGGSIGKQTQKLRSGMAYFKKELLNSSSRGVTILIEISMQWNNARNSFVFGYKAWLVNRTDQSRTNKQNRSAAMLCKKPFASCGSIVREAAIIEAIALDFLNKFELESEVFNFAGFRLVRAVRGRDPTLNTLSLLKCAIARFCPKLQAR